MAATQSPPGIRTRAFAYDGFRGIDSSRDEAAQDSGSRQTLVQLVNGYCDTRGQIIRDPTATRLLRGPPVIHLRHYGRNGFAWAERVDGGLNLVADRGARVDTVWPSNASPSSAVFNRRLIVGARALPPWQFDGAQWRALSSPSLAQMGPAYYTAIQRRLAVAGIPGRETQVHISRVDDETVFPDNEDPGSANVLRAGFIDVANVLNTADEIRGIAPWEQNRIAISTSDRTLVYRLDPDIDQWAIDDRANIMIGCLSHNAMASAGADLLMPSRNGIHSVRRAGTAGTPARAGDRAGRRPSVRRGTGARP